MSLAVTVEQQEPHSSAARLSAPESERRMRSHKRKHADARRNHYVPISKTAGQGVRVQSWKRTNAAVGVGSVIDRDNMGRKGRQFIVGNVGNNGMIYLRPVMRPTQQRPQAPISTFLTTTSDTANNGTDDGWRLSYDWHEPSFFGSHTSLASIADQPDAEVNLERKPVPLSTAPRRFDSVRAHSFSTVDEHTRVERTDPGTFKIVISRPSPRRPRTADAYSMPSFDPQAGRHRNDMADDSGYRGAVTSDVSPRRPFALQKSREAVNASPIHSTPNMTPQSNRYGGDVQTELEEGSPESYANGSVSHTSPRPASAASNTQPWSQQSLIQPALFDALTKNPDDPSVVRFSSSTGAIIAATPARLIAHITSPSFLDYELLSDFFLTFRAYMTTSDLVCYLIARLQWAVSRPDDFGRIVRVRTFVALRHWILNYFVDDFLPDYRLRMQFCRLVNSLNDQLRRRYDGGGGDLKIVGELKKCWRRTCALYWDLNDPGARLLMDEPIHPGGRLGSRDSGENSEDKKLLHGNLPYAVELKPERKRNDAGTPPMRQNASGEAQHVQQSPVTSALHPYDQVEPSNVRMGEQSVQAGSYTVPLRTTSRADKISEPSYSPYLAPIGQPPLLSSIAGKPSYSRKRSGSFSDALMDRRSSFSGPRDDRAPLGSNLTFPGSLIRGAQYQPASPYIDSIVPGSPTDERIRFDFDDDNEDEFAGSLTGLVKPSYLQPPGMKKFLGSVKKVLSSRQSRSQVSFEEDMAASSQNLRKSSDLATVAGRLSTAPLHKRSKTRLRIPPRIDILAAGVNESFRTMIKEQQTFREEEAGNEAAKALQVPLTGIAEHTTAPLRPLVARPLDILESGEIDVNTASGLKEHTDPLPAANPKPSGAFLPLQTVQPRDLRDYVVKQRQHPVVNEGANAWLSQQNHLYEDQLSRLPNAAPPIARLPPTHRRQHSSQSSFSAAHSLRRYNSYQSGMSSLTERAERAPTTHRPAKPGTVTGSTAANPPPTHQLRRRPGGNLREVDNVHDLEPLKRSRSTGSMSNYAHSITNSAIPYPPAQNGRNDDIQPTFLSPNGPPKKISLVATHSSQPNMRASFQAEVSKLAALPDDDDDGGVESALLKLEGRYQKPAKAPRDQKLGLQTDHPQPSVAYSSPDEQLVDGADFDARLAAQGVKYSFKQRYESVTAYRPSGTGKDGDGRAAAPTSAAEVKDSYSFVPFLKGGVSHARTSQAKQSDEWVQVQMPMPLRHAEGSLNPGQNLARYDAGEFRSGTSGQYVERTFNLHQTSPGTGGPLSSQGMEHDGFLDDGTDDLDGLSSDLSTETPGDSVGPGMQSFYYEGRIFPSTTDGLLHPWPQLYPGPSMTAHLQASPDVPGSERLAIRHGSQVLERGSGKALPSDSLSGAASSDRDTNSRKGYRQTAMLSPQTAHLPFILAYDSETLAQQFTIIEKDALDEIDWKELIELRWKQNAAPIRNWVEYLKNQEPRGVDLAITRFNLMAKWALSECVLTSKLDERVRCIVKYIHIAAHARRLRNYATMFQITMALSSSDCSRLTKTWSLVPAADIQTLRNLETLIQPMRNFHNLRVEMERVTGDEGCIPFIGIFTHDLIYNAQKPALIYPTPDSEPLVNFERHHTAASIVKSLLRLLEASSNYKFKPEPEVISRCLWMATLPDDEISRLSFALE